MAKATTSDELMTTSKEKDTDLKAQAEEQKELIAQVNADLKASIADEFKGLETREITKESLEADPEKTSRNFIRLYADFRKLEAQVNALKKERTDLLPQAARTQVLERRLVAIDTNSAVEWVAVPSLNDGDLICMAANLSGGNGKADILLKFSNGKVIHTMLLNRGNLIPLSDGIFRVRSSS